MARKSEEEYKAQAMLLGMNYDPLMNVFYDFSETGELVEYDADTMQYLSPEQVTERVRERIDVGVRHITYAKTKNT